MVPKLRLAVVSATSAEQTCKTIFRQRQMERIEGIIKIEERTNGSKSQGAVAIITTGDGKEYILYRSEMLPENDPFFTQFNNQNVVINGETETSGYICVASVESENGVIMTPEFPEYPIASAPLFIGDLPIKMSEESKPLKGKRLPRKLKKLLKKKLINNK